MPRPISDMELNGLMLVQIIQVNMSEVNPAIIAVTVWRI